MEAINPRPIWQRWNLELVSLAPYIVLGVFLLTLPLFMRPDLVSVFSRILIFAVFALSLDLIFGYAGMWSLGHAAFFGIGGYAAGILVMKGGIESFWLATPAAILITGLIAVIFGYISLRASGVYFLLITFALGQLLYGVVWKWRLTGGADGLSGIPVPQLGFAWSVTTTNMYYLVFGIFVICYVLLYLVIKSPFGHTLKGIGENELRMRSLGYNAWMYKYLAYIVAALFAGAAGALFAPFGGIVHPTHVDVTSSTLVMIMVIIGGSKTILGPLVGSGVIILLQYLVSIYIPERWPMIVGAVFVATVMYAHGGIVIYLNKIWTRANQRYGSIKG
jgi:branched-chain amino acid transport system permease protein